MSRLKIVLAAMSLSISIGAIWILTGVRSSGNAGPGVVASPADAGINHIYAGGIVEGAQREVSLQFEVTGRIEKINVHEGDRVEKGDVLAALDAGLFELKLAEAGTQLKLARAERDRLTAGSKVTARREDLSIADSKVALAEGTVRQERLLLEKTELRAPTSGIVLRVRAEPGELAGPGAGDLIVLVNRDVTRVRAHVEELDALNVTLGQRAVVTADGLPGRSFQGIIRGCAPWVGPKTHRHLKPGEMLDVRVREILIDLVEGDDLLIGLPVDVLISLEPPPSEDPGSDDRPRSRLSGPPAPPRSVVQ